VKGQAIRRNVLGLGRRKAVPVLKRGSEVPTLGLMTKRAKTRRYKRENDKGSCLGELVPSRRPGDHTCNHRRRERGG